MKKLMSLIIMAMFALTMSLGTFSAPQDKSTAKTTSTEHKTKKAKNTKRTWGTSTKSTKKAPASTPSK